MDKYGIVQKKRNQVINEMLGLKDESQIGVLFHTETKEMTKDEADKIDYRSKAVIKQGEGGATKLANNVDRNIYTEGNELASKALNDNIIDFHDKRIKVSNQKASQWKSQINADLVQIDLGKVRSLNKSQIMVDHIDFKNVPKGVNIVDAETAKNSEYDLVLVGRKLKEGEVADMSLQEFNDENDK